ncbi:hypothetical protein [Pseudomonas muyukensis]|uniref:Uncharacterized protein n=1 Tax=Pseudomonas muyukensis TaxID=2842357 RepID=A0ABX8M1T7_9PSED|nr:hypothetical protein [Pseudomonas muyukensis]QXH33095.1 hypothetical protein KSS95_12920 [Pseudomonas muyukensis]
MDRDTQREISNIVEYVHDEATKEFANVRSPEPYETHVSSGDSHPDRVRLIGEGIRVGLRDYYRPERITVTVAESGYFIRIQRA